MAVPTVGMQVTRTSERLATKRAIEASLAETEDGPTGVQQSSTSPCPAGVSDTPTSLVSMTATDGAAVVRRSRISESLDTATEGTISCLRLTAKCLSYPFIYVGSGLLKMVLAMTSNKTPALENSAATTVQATQSEIAESEVVTIDTAKNDLYAAELNALESSNEDKPQLASVRTLLDGFFKALCDKYPDDLPKVCAKFRKAVPEIVADTGVFGDVLSAALTSMSRAERSRKRKVSDVKKKENVSSQETKIEKAIKNLMVRAEKATRVKKVRATA